MHKIIDYLSGVAYAHAVNPILFVLIYALSTIPFLLISGWLVHHIQRRRPLSFLFFLWGLCYSAPYLYVLAVGRNLSLWVYLMVAALIAGGLALAGRGLMRRIQRDQD